MDLRKQVLARRMHELFHTTFVTLGAGAIEYGIWLLALLAGRAAA